MHSEINNIFLLSQLLLSMQKNKTLVYEPVQKMVGNEMPNPAIFYDFFKFIFCLKLAIVAALISFLFMVATIDVYQVQKAPGSCHQYLKFLQL